jgi:hypothetical protein
VTDSFDYLESRDDADELIQEFGAAASVRRITNSGTDYAPTQDADLYPTFAAKVEFTRKQMQGGNVLENDERWLVAAGTLAVSILPGDALVVGGVVKPVLKVDTLAPAGVTVLFDCHIRN